MAWQENRYKNIAYELPEVFFDLYLSGKYGTSAKNTFDQIDYSFQILNSKPISKSDQEIQILLNGVTTTLIKDDSGWHPKTAGDFEKAGLATAIGKAIALRYRI